MITRLYYQQSNVAQGGAPLLVMNARARFDAARKLDLVVPGASQ